MRECQFCKSPLEQDFVDLGMSPLCEDFVRPDKVHEMEPFYPLHVYVCDQCWLLQLDEFVSPEKIYEDYLYFSSYSSSWLKHASDYTDKMVAEFGISPEHLVVEIASNDGYLLQFFQQKGIPVLGIEPSKNVAQAASTKGIRTEQVFFGQKAAEKLSAQYGQADLLLGNNVLAHVPKINDFVAGMQKMLKPTGILTMEFPHLQRLIEGNQFDTIYHEHFSYLSFVAVQRIFEAHGLRLFHVEELASHGGSIRIFGCHDSNEQNPDRDSVIEMARRERALGYESMAVYRAFEEKVKETKRKLLEFLIEKTRQGKQVVGYGAPGKGNTLLNYCGIRTDFLAYTVDRNPKKQGCYLPGTRIPIFHPDKIRETKPDFVLILPWNLKKEISKQMNFIGEWGGKFVVPIPEVEVFEPPV
jgi:SAM-dependent methyltransferase